MFITVIVSSCSRVTEETTPKEDVIQNTETTVLSTPSTDPPPTPVPSKEASPTPASSPTSEPSTEASPTVEGSNGEQMSPVGQILLEERCIECHNLSRVTSKSKTLEEWRRTVERMVDKGTVLSEAEQETLIDYLAETYP